VLIVRGRKGEREGGCEPAPPRPCDMVDVLEKIVWCGVEFMLRIVFLEFDFSFDRWRGKRLSIWTILYSSERAS
jgi:hypothetical protein